MSFTSFTLALPCLLFLLLLLLSRLTRADPLRDIPGPFLARWTSLLLAYHTRTGKRYLYIHSLHKRYGPHVRITPTQVSCATPAAPGIIYAQGALSLPKSPFYRAFYVAGTPSLFSTQDRAGHAQKRRRLAHPFSYASVRAFDRWIRRSMRKFVRGLDEKAGGEGERVDMLMWLNFLTFDVISDLAFGEPLGMLDRRSDVITEESAAVQASKDDPGVAAMIDYRGRTAALLGLFPLLLPIAKWLPDAFIQRGLKGTDALSSIATRCVSHRLRTPTTSRRGDLLDRLVDGMDDDDGDGETREEDVVTEAMLLLTAGSDTTANSTAAILFHALGNRRVWDRLREEVDDALVNADAEEEEEEEEDGLTEADGLPHHDTVKSLKYLQATIDEGLRMFATNAFGLPRVVPQGKQVQIGDRLYPEGTELSSPAYTIQHSPSIWTDPHVFRPERWLAPDAPALKKHLLTFGMGPRACIGKNLAYMQMQLLLATLVSRYDMELRDTDLRSVEGFMHKPVDMWVRVRKRRAV